jgi:hypothetical protein
MQSPMVFPNNSPRAEGQKLEEHRKLKLFIED